MDKASIKRLFGMFKPYALKIIFAALCGLVGTLLSLYAPVLIGQVVDGIAGAGQVEFALIAPLLVRLAATIAASAGFTYLLARLSNAVTFSILRDLRVSAFKKLNELPLSFIDSHAHGDILSRIIGDIDRVGDGLLQGFTQLFKGIVTIIGTLVFMLSINVSIALIVIVITPLSLFVALLIARRSFKLFTKKADLDGDIGAYAEEYISNHSVVAAFSYEGAAQKEFEKIDSRLYDVGVRAQFVSSLTNPSTRFINALVYAGVGIFGALSALNGALSVGQLSSFLIYAGQYTRPFNEISAVLAELQASFASLKRIFALLDEASEKPDEADAIHITNTEGNVRFEDISFSYEPDKKLIQHLSFIAQSGQKVAIVGPTGAGKTTLINLLMRFYDIDSGAILLDGVNIGEVTKGSLRALYGMVLQDTWLFSGSVRENIAYGREDATMEEVISAAKAAHAHSFIKKLPNGYDTILSSDDEKLSAGQKQLLCIARAMLVSPPMLILDEATSNIDTRIEQKVQDAFSKLMKGRTSFVVAHRLSTIKEADIILVLKDGNIVEQGTHEALLAQGGFYAALYKVQFEGKII